jgi:hypothetical protein
MPARRAGLIAAGSRDLGKRPDVPGRQVGVVERDRTVHQPDDDLGPATG